MGIHKPFDKSIYEVSDKAKYIVAKKLNSLGYYTNLEEDYGADIKSYHPKRGCQEHEVEHRQIWNKGDFPYNTIHIPERKNRLLNSNLLYYWVVNKDGSYAYVCNATNNMKVNLLVMIENNLVPTGEEFYDIPIKNFKKIKLRG